MTTPGNTGTVIVDARNGMRGGIDDWVAAFARHWDAPAEDIDGLLSLLSDDVSLQAPSWPPRAAGKAQARFAFETTFALLPDLRAEVTAHAFNGADLFIGMRYHATIGRKKISWHAVDHFRFSDGVARSRTAFFNPRKIRRALLATPSAWPRLVRTLAAVIRKKTDGNT